MGNCVSSQDREAQQRSQEIDKQIEEDSRRFKKECKILLLGAYSVFSRRLLFCAFRVARFAVSFRRRPFSFLPSFHPPTLPPSSLISHHTTPRP